ncbi:MAG: GntR family transcriptional regulator [Steroidobacteraceae bacterium]|nr:GntR family transcriptional regulator [Steroidobacteraceae bacterium]
MSTRRRKSVLSSTADAGITRYLQLYSILSQALADGEYKSSRALPSEPELVERYRVSRTTVRRALQLLEQEGRIVRRRGSGTYAKTNRVHTALAFDAESLYGNGAVAGRDSGTQILERAPMDVPTSLRIAYPELGDTAFAIQRARSEDGETFQLATTYVPDSAAREYGLRRGGTTGLEKLVKDVRNVDQVTTAVAADAIAAKQLKVAIGSPLLRVRAALTDSKGELLAVDESLLRPDRAYLHENLRRERAGRARPRWQLQATH